MCTKKGGGVGILLKWSRQEGGWVFDFEFNGRWPKDFMREVAWANSPSPAPMPTSGCYVIECFHFIAHFHLSLAFTIFVSFPRYARIVIIWNYVSGLRHTIWINAAHKLNLCSTSFVLCCCCCCCLHSLLILCLYEKHGVHHEIALAEKRNRIEISFEIGSYSICEMADRKHAHTHTHTTKTTKCWLGWIRSAGRVERERTRKWCCWQITVKVAKITLP